MNHDKNSLKNKIAQILTAHGETKAARYLAFELFKEKVDKAGAPYVGHLERVANGVVAPYKAIAWLHDLLEDIEEWNREDLEEIGFSEFTIRGIEAVTKENDNVFYFDEMVRVGLTPQAIPVKKSDLRDNGNLMRLHRVPTKNDFERTKKYYLAYHYLDDIEAGRATPGTLTADWMRAQPPERQDWDLLKRNTKPTEEFVSPSRNPAP